MAKKQYNFPEDQFDSPDPKLDLPGVHRKPRSKFRWLVAILLTALFGIAAGLATAYIIDSLGVTEPKTSNTATAEPGEVGEEETPEPTDEPSGEPTATEPTVTNEPEPTPTETPEPTPTETEETVDRTVGIQVDNGTRTRGLAARTKEKLDGAGWERVSTGDHRATSWPNSVVIYSDAEHELEARAVANDLGITLLELDEETRQDIRVILRDDFDL